MKEEFECASLDVFEFDAKDIITTSGQDLPEMEL
jgi:hypothetical protein